MSVLILSILFSSALCVDAIGLDLGSEFFKIAKSKPDGQVQIHIDAITNSVNTLTSTAIKFTKPNISLQSERDFEDIEVRFGTPARRLLKSNRSLGYAFPPYIVGRMGIGMIFEGAIASEFELFTLALENALQKVSPFNALTIAVPIFFTPTQLLFIQEACRRFRLPLVSLLYDVHAVAIAYGSLRLSRFIQHPKHVMFVDIGAMSTKVYSHIFEYNNFSSPGKDYVNSKQTSIEWSEKVGGFHFSMNLVRDKNISRQKAEKQLHRNNGVGFEDLMEEELEVLESLLINATVQAETVSPIDEIQLLGGASTLKFVVDTIKRVTNHSIRRDFTANEAIALGAAIGSLEELERSPYIAVHTSRLSHADINLTCGNLTTPICKKGSPCQEFAQLNGLPGICQEFTLEVEKEHLPWGASWHMLEYNTTQPVGLGGSDNFSATFLLTKEPTVEEVRWCNLEGNCVEHTTNKRVPADYQRIYNGHEWVYHYIKAQGNRATRKIVIQELEKLSAFRTKLERGNVEATRPMTDEMKDSLNELTALVEADGLDSLDGSALSAWKEKLEGMAEKLHYKL